MLHIENGLRILAAAAHRLPASHSDGPAIDGIRPVSMRLNVLCSLMDRETPPAYATAAGPADNDSDEGQFSPQWTLRTPEFQLVGLLDTGIRFIGQANAKAAAFCIGVDDLVEQARLQRRLNAWRQQLDQMVQQTA